MEPHCSAINFKALDEKYKYANLTLEELSSICKPKISPLPSEDDKDDEDIKIEEDQEIFKYRITLKLFYRKTYNQLENDYCFEKEKILATKSLILCDEPDCYCFPENEFDIDKFMLREENYMDFLQHVMSWYEVCEDVDNFCGDFEYINGGIIKLTLYSTINYNKYEIKENIMEQWFEESMYRASPGFGGIIALHQKDKSTNEHVELGLIDCRDERCIRVKRIK